jgi:UDP-2,4-diacetamido-2,4,6-trideoxy-beta-L-altropyranose hydrolase
MSAPSLVVRANATPEIGAGHVMRCISFAEAWSAEGQGEAAVWGTVSIPFVKARLKESGIALHNSAPSGEISVLMVDSYDEHIRRSVPGATRARLRVLVDDLGELTEGYDVIWNPNAYSADSLYSGFTGRVISGPESVPIRSGLPRWSAASPAIAVTLGGTRPRDWLVEAVRIWSGSLPDQPVAGESSWIPSAWKAVSAERAWSAFAKCSMMVSSAGSTVWEAANVGIPVCLLMTASNQRLAAEWAVGHGVPLLDAVDERDPAAFAKSLNAAIGRASVLPHLRSGARAAARTIHRIAAKREQL